MFKRETKHLTVPDAIRMLAIALRNGEDSLYMETGAFKPFMPPTLRALERRGFRVDRIGEGVYRLYPQ